jgi:hypothetical protein
MNRRWEYYKLPFRIPWFLRSEIGFNAFLTLIAVAIILGIIVYVNVIIPLSLVMR